MSVLSDALMRLVHDVQLSAPVCESAGSLTDDSDSYGCRNECSGSCDGSCYGSCDTSCSGGCDHTF